MLFAPLKVFQGDHSGDHKKSSKSFKDLQRITQRRDLIPELNCGSGASQLGRRLENGDTICCAAKSVQLAQVYTVRISSIENCTRTLPSGPLVTFLGSTGTTSAGRKNFRLKFGTRRIHFLHVIRDFTQFPWHICTRNHHPVTRRWHDQKDGGASKTIHFAVSYFIRSDFFFYFGNECHPANQSESPAICVAVTPSQGRSLVFFIVFDSIQHFMRVDMMQGPYFWQPTASVMAWKGRVLLCCRVTGKLV